MLALTTLVTITFIILKPPLQTRYPDFLDLWLQHYLTLDVVKAVWLNFNKELIVILRDLVLDL
jgi:hypothetical protein